MVVVIGGTLCFVHGVVAHIEDAYADFAGVIAAATVNVICC